MHNQENETITRRSFGLGAAGAVAAGVSLTMATSATPAAETVDKKTETVDGKKGRLKQSVCKWCYGKLSLEDMCKEAVKLGLVGIDLLRPEDFPMLKQYGLVCTMVSSSPLSDGLCDEKYHESSLKAMNDAIEATSAAGFRNVICFSGNARGIDRKTGMKNCVAALKKIVGVAEKKNVILNMELLNSRVDHADYMCDNSAWGIELCKEVGSNNFKLLYDIYHMQIMEGDIIRTIQQNFQYIGHFHTAGNPGRHEFDETQEIYYPPICKAIADLGYQGILSHEYTPTKDALPMLEKMMRICEV